MMLATLLRSGVLAAIISSPSPPPPDERPKYPFGIGERLIYDVKFGRMRVGEGAMEVIDTPTVRGRPTFHGQFRVSGKKLWYSVNDTMETWMDRETMHSLRFTQDLQEGSRRRNKHFEIYPDQKMYVEMDKSPDKEQESVAAPLDDASFLYFLRTMELKVGETYTFHQYFRPDRNPVRIHVLRRERITVPAGTFDAIVVQPRIKAKGIFAEKGDAKVWLSDDDKRIMLQLKSDLPIGSLNLYLKSYTPPKGPTR
jgi:hypothetical protein